MKKRLLTLSVSLSLLCQAGPGSGPAPEGKSFPGESTAQPSHLPTEQLPAAAPATQEPVLLDQIADSFADLVEWFKSSFD